MMARVVLFIRWVLASLLVLGCLTAVSALVLAFPVGMLWVAILGFAGLVGLNLVE